MLNKKCNKCGFQQNEFLNIGGKKYCKSCDFEINNKDENIKKTELITVSAYESQSTYDLLYGSLEWLELYIEKTNYYPNWKSKKQLPKTIVRSDIDSIGSTRMQSMFSTSLTSLRSLTRSKPDFFLGKLQGEFYEWLDGSGISVDSCPSELTQCLINLFEILKGKGEEFAKARREEVRKNIERMSNEEREMKFNEIFSAYHEPLENEEKKAKSMEGQTYKDVSNESKFAGNAGKGKKTFELIKKQQEISQREATRQRELEYLNRGDEMETDESASSSSPAGSSNQSNPQQNFSAQPINWNLIIDVGQNKNDWEVKPVVASHNYVAGRWYQGQPELMLIHRTVKELGYNQANGDLIIQSKKMYKIKDFNDGERAEIEGIFGSFQTVTASSAGYNQKTSFYQFELAKYEASRKGQNKGIGAGVIPVIISVASAFAIAGIVLVKKSLRKKVKK